MPLPSTYPGLGTICKQIMAEECGEDIKARWEMMTLNELNEMMSNELIEHRPTIENAFFIYDTLRFVFFLMACS